MVIKTGRGPTRNLVISYIVESRRRVEGKYREMRYREMRKGYDTRWWKYQWHLLGGVGQPRLRTIKGGGWLTTRTKVEVLGGKRIRKYSVLDPNGFDL